MRKLIIIRGNSGSGKSTVAKLIREQASNPAKVALIEQDYLRRIVLKEKEHDNGLNINLIKQTAVFALKHDYDVIVEGILYSKRYRQMLHELMDIASHSYVYYLDIPFAETLRRHKTKPNSHEFGESEMRSWYRKSDLLDIGNEVVFDENVSQIDMVNTILRDSSL